MHWQEELVYCSAYVLETTQARIKRRGDKTFRDVLELPGLLRLRNAKMLATTA